MSAIEKHDEMYDTYLVKGDNPHIMYLMGSYYKGFVHEINKTHPKAVEDLMGKMEAGIESLNWNNYLTEKEANGILATLTPSAIWTTSDVHSACESLGVICEKKPHWNLQSLTVVMNDINSNQGKTLKSLVATEDEYVVLIYKLAIDLLEDKDNVRYVRKRFLGEPMA